METTIALSPEASKFASAFAAAAAAVAAAASAPGTPRASRSAVRTGMFLILGTIRNCKTLKSIQSSPTLTPLKPTPLEAAGPRHNVHE